MGKLALCPYFLLCTLYVLNTMEKGSTVGGVHGGHYLEHSHLEELVQVQWIPVHIGNLEHYSL